MRNHTDMRIQSEIGKVPKGEGWKLWSGSSSYNEWYRIVRTVNYNGEVEAVLIHHDDDWVDAS